MHFPRKSFNFKTPKITSKTFSDQNVPNYEIKRNCGHTKLEFTENKKVLFIFLNTHISHHIQQHKFQGSQGAGKLLHHSSLNDSLLSTRSGTQRKPQNIPSNAKRSIPPCALSN